MRWATDARGRAAHPVHAAFLVADEYQDPVGPAYRSLQQLAGYVLPQEVLDMIVRDPLIGDTLLMSHELVRPSLRKLAGVLCLLALPVAFSPLVGLTLGTADPAVRPFHDRASAQIIITRGPTRRLPGLRAASDGAIVPHRSTERGY